MNLLINILALCDRDLHESESGGARTVIMVNNYLAAVDGITIYSSYKHLSPVDPRIIEIPITSNFTKESINKIITEKKINILLIMEGEKYAHLGRQAVEGTNCKIITEFHTMPGFETHSIWYDAVHNLIDRNIQIKKRILSLIKIFLFPLCIKYIEIKNRKRLQQAYYDADCLVVLSKYYIDEYKNRYLLKENSKITAIGNALSFKREITNEDLLLKKNTILIVSRLEERNKRLSISIKAWSKLCNKYPDWDMQIVGSGIDEQLYRKMAKKMKLRNITFLGHQDPEYYYSKASIFIMSSAYEGWGMVLTEALQKGCVPVCMDSFSAVHEIINDKSDGFIVQNNNLKEFIEKIEYLINNPETRKAIALNGVINSRRFSMDNIGPKWVALFKQVLEKNIA
jgi:glycosyltransferase involved in cell wall biosynthesis